MEYVGLAVEAAVEGYVSGTKGLTRLQSVATENKDKVISSKTGDRILINVKPLLLKSGVVLQYLNILCV